MMPPDRRSPKPRLQSALASGGWADYGPAPQREPQWEPQRAPLPAGLLAGLVVLLDAAAVVLAGQLLPLPPAGAPALIGFLALLVPGLIAVTGGYAHGCLFGGRRALLTALAGLVLGVGALALAAVALRAEDSFPPTTGLAWLALAAPPLLFGRWGSGRLLRSAAGRTRHRAVLVGDGPQAARFVAALSDRPDRSVDLLGIISDRADAAAGAGLPQLGPLPVLLGMVQRGEVDQIILAIPWADEARLDALVRLFADHPVGIRLAPDLMAYRGLGEAGPDAARHRLLRISDRPICGWGAAVKLLEDYALAALGLAVCALPMLLIALAIRLESPGPVLFRQRRTGFNHRDFMVLKFRTLYHHAADHAAARQVSAGDPRVTRVGALLRRSSLDELPQLFNILRGEMSVIGPRPHAPGTTAAGRPFEQVAARYAARHRVKPGLTGLAQVRGWRGPTDTEEKLIRRVESDLEYIDRWSPWLDGVILVRTLVAVALMRNAC